MKAEELHIHYRPELAEQLQQALISANEYYNVNYQKMYYLFTAEAFKDTSQEWYDFFQKAAECFNGSFSGYEIFDSEYKPIIEKQFDMEIPSEARAAKHVFEIYELVFEILKEQCLSDDLTKAEVFNINSFFTKITAPLKNPNLQIPEGETKCLYDRDYHHSFKEVMKNSLEYINRECPYLIEQFATPEEQEETQSNVIIR